MLLEIRRVAPGCWSKSYADMEKRSLLEWWDFLSFSNRYFRELEKSNSISNMVQITI